MPCSPTDVSFPSPSTPTGPAIPGLGIPFSIPSPSIAFPAGFPEDLLYILNLLQLLIPPGALKPSLNFNFGKDIFDGIMKLLDQFMPFLMLYKFFLPFLNIIICIIEVLCSLLNPIALASALSNLFTQCIPAFLNLFPIFALIIMIISLLLLLLALIEYIISQVIKFVLALLRNINALVKAFQSANANSVAAIAKKLGALLCVFQNIFVLLAVFGIIIQIIKDILSMIFSIPPCAGGEGSTTSCCNSNTCPTIVQNQYTNTTGTFQYMPEAGTQTTLALPGGKFFNIDARTESWQLYDQSQTLPQQFWNIVDGYDVTQIPKPIYFPTDASYSATTSPQQAAYTVDLRLLYNPAQWGRAGSTQYIRFKDCIVLAAPTQTLLNWDNVAVPISTGVFYLAGGSGFLDDGVTQLDGYMADGYTPLSPRTQATLNNFLHTPAKFSATPMLSPTDGYTFSDMQYTFKPNLIVLMQKNLVTAGCEPTFVLAKAFVNNVMFSNIASQTNDLKSLVNGTLVAGTPPTNVTFPDPAGAQQCLTTAVSNLRSNMTVSGVAEFQAAANVCLNKLQNDTISALGAAIGIGFSPCNSSFSLTPNVQFTTQPITISVSLNENNGINLTQGIPVSVADSLATQIVAYPTFGTVSNFTYDGYQFFTATITSEKPGGGNIMVAFQNQILCTNTLPLNGTPNHTLQNLNYQFVYAPGVESGTQPRRDLGDVARDTSDGGGD
jgi:hypothetical protein